MSVVSGMELATANAIASTITATPTRRHKKYKNVNLDLFNSMLKTIRHYKLSYSRDNKLL